MKLRKKIRTRFFVYISAIGLLILLTAALLATGRHPRQTEDWSVYVWRDEIPAWMEFARLDSEDWQHKIGSKGRMTRNDVAAVLEQMHLSGYIQVPGNGRYVTREDWIDVYEQLLDYYDEQEIVRREIIVLDIEPELVTAVEGSFHYIMPESVQLEPFYCYQVYCSSDQILGISQKDVKDALIENEYIITCQDGVVSFLCDNQEYQVPASSEEQLAGVVGDLVFSGGKITTIRKKEDTILGKLIALTDTYADIKGYGQVPCSDTMKFYSTYDGIHEAKKEELLLENMEITYVVAEGKVCAFLMEKPPDIENIRVLLLNGKSPYYEDIFINADVPVVVSEQEQQLTLGAGELLAASSYQETLSRATLTVSAEDGVSPLYLTDSNGNRVSYGYEGILELRSYAEGYCVVNVVPLESYLKGVIPSEMPSSYDPEALKSQAVCARSYAYIQMMENNYQRLGAHIDDSTAYQVYNKQEHGSSTDQAVDDTYGQVLKFSDQVIEAYYFSTSYGHTGDYSAWKLDPEEYPYLTGSWLRDGENGIDLSDESAFSDYIRSPDESCYESDLKYFRWNTELHFADRTEALKNRITDRKSIQPDMISYETPNMAEEAASMNGFGSLTGIKVNGRSETGVIAELILQFEYGTVHIAGEYNIRHILGAGLDQINWQDGSSSDSMTILPSSYITVIRVDSDTYIVYGGGYGHGLGMSQKGAQQLALQGWQAPEILQLFYPGTDISRIY